MFTCSLFTKSVVNRKCCSFAISVSCRLLSSQNTATTSNQQNKEDRRIATPTSPTNPSRTKGFKKTLNRKVRLQYLHI